MSNLIKFHVKCNKGTTLEENIKQAYIEIERQLLARGYKVNNVKVQLNKK
jgi:hypothetical protein